MGNNIIIVSGASGQGNKHVIELCNKYKNMFLIRVNKIIGQP